MTINNIPKAINPTISLGVKALEGAINVGDEIDLSQNAAPKITVDLFDLIGDPATPAIPGKHARYTAQVVAVADAYAAVRVAVGAGREYCRLAIGVLKSVLGTRWNTQWQAAGFTTPSLALPDDPVPMLLGFREYFKANPAKEVAPINVTAARAQLLVDNIQDAGAAVASAKQLRVAYKAARDASLRKLKERLSGLRGELDQILSDDDGRWYEFGFRRPADGSMPLPVPDLVLTPVGPGTVLAQWGLASLAENYRVSWRIAGSADEPMEIGLFTDRQATLTALPSGANIVVGVSARNDSGETEPTEAAIVVP
jgi:hypothetical protein